MLLTQAHLLVNRNLPDKGADARAAAIDLALADPQLFLDQRDVLFLDDAAMLLAAKLARLAGGLESLLLLGLLLVVTGGHLPGAHALIVHGAAGPAGPAVAAPLLLALVEIDAVRFLEDLDRLVRLMLVTWAQTKKPPRLMPSE
jgi:hypothetical protein